jgi:hypothetical protein
VDAGHDAPEGGSVSELEARSGPVRVDAGWRAVWGGFFRERRDAATLAWFNANARLRLLVLMFRKRAGVHGRAFETEDEAVAWLHEQSPDR